MVVIANGSPVELPPQSTMGDLLATMGLGSSWVVAERNGDALPRATMTATPLAEGDRIELVRAVAGG